MAKSGQRRGKSGQKRPKLGSGARFKALRRQGKSAALAAFIGRRKYGKKRFAKLSAAGRKRKAKARRRK